MFLDQSKRTKKEMTRDEHNANQVGQEGWPETAVYIRDNADNDQGDADS
jgi:hypothetical protein